MQEVVSRPYGRFAAFAVAALALSGVAPVRLDEPAPARASAAERVREARGLGAAVVYGVVPPLFGDPPLRAVTRGLPDLQDLGVDVLWLSPVFEAPPGDYGYAVTDYSHVRPSYGSDDDLRELVDAAHRLGMRVVLDFVPNHTSSRHPWFTDAEARGRASPYYAYYARDADARPTHYFDWDELPNLDYGNEAVASAMMDVTTRWMRDYRVDGFRMDVAWGVRERTPGLWARWVAALRREAPRSLLLAEASARDPAYFAAGFDAAYDWTERQGEWAWSDAFDDPARIADAVWRDLDGAAGPTLRFLDNNDTGPRFLTRYGADMTRVAAAMLLTLPGLPCLFTGDERGAEYEPYAARGPLGPGAHPELRAWYRALIALRRAHPALERGETLRVTTRGAPGVFAYVRRDARSGEAVLVALQFAPRVAHAILDLPAAIARAAVFTDALAGTEARAAAGVVELDLPAWGVFVGAAPPSSM